MHDEKYNQMHQKNIAIYKKIEWKDDCRIFDQNRCSSVIASLLSTLYFQNVYFAPLMVIVLKTPSDAKC